MRTYLYIFIITLSYDFLKTTFSTKILWYFVGVDEKQKAVYPKIYR